MIRTVTVTNHKKESLTMDLFHPEYSGLNITNIDGLGPAQANINITDMATVDGGLFSSARQQRRNIVFTFKLMMEPSIEDVRLKIYKYFPIKKKVSLKIKTDRRTSECSGYVESVTPDIFQQEETCQVSIICPDPNFYSVGDVGGAFNGINPLFESPFYDEFNRVDGWPADIWSSGDSNVVDTFELSAITLETTAVFTYSGDIDTGVLITIHAMDDVTNITLWNNDTREHISIDTDKIRQITGIQYGNLDDILINTKRGERYVKLLHEGTYYDILSAVNRDADFFQLTSGTNIFSFQADSGEDALIVTFTYKNAYGGI